jgi:hypothetical protein
MKQMSEVACGLKSIVVLASAAPYYILTSENSCDYHSSSASTVAPNSHNNLLVGQRKYVRNRKKDDIPRIVSEGPR